VNESQCQTGPDSVWEKSPTANLYRYKPSGMHFVRARVGGKLIRKSLRNPGVCSVAALKLQDELKQHRELDELHQRAEGGKMTFGDALAIYRGELDADAHIKPRTRDYYNERITALLKTWPGLEKLDVRKITPADCRAWAAPYRRDSHPTAYNNTVTYIGRWAT
jgi:hypothetical protein